MTKLETLALAIQDDLKDNHDLLLSTKASTWATTACLLALRDLIGEPNMFNAMWRAISSQEHTLDHDLSGCIIPIWKAGLDHILSEGPK